MNEKEKKFYVQPVARVGIRTALAGMAFAFNRFERFRKYLRNADGWNNFSVGIKTQDGSVAATIEFKDGKATTRAGAENVTSQMILQDESVMMALVSLPPNELNNLLLKNKLLIKGNYSYISYFNFLMSVLLKNKQVKDLKAQREKMKLPTLDSEGKGQIKNRQMTFVKADSRDPGVKHLEDQNLSAYGGLVDFPRLKRFVDIHHRQKPAVCIERPKLMTRWYRENGFENDKQGKPWVAELRQAEAFKYLMENRKPIIRKDDLIAGTSGSKESSVLLYPDGAGTILWGELFIMQDRPLNPYDIDPDDAWALNNEIFPYYFKRNFREWIRDVYDEPLYQEVDERFALFFLWKNVALSHTILDYPKLLRLGADGIIEEIKAELDKTSEQNFEKRNTLKAMILTYEGIVAYALNLSKQALLDMEAESDPKRKEELKKLADICARVPKEPCQSLDDAVNAVWIHWVAVHMESTNAGFSLGRMDQWLQPYFESDIEKLKTKEEKEEYIRHAIELVGCFYMRCTDHLPTIPDIGNYLFGGSSSDQAITLGGVTPEGEDGVNDMTYIFLKATEILSIRDPNVNARYSEKNTEAYLKRLCEVNINTAGTPSIHNDEAVMQSLERFNYPPEHLRDWAATGCVEPTISGKHMGHTNCMMFNMVAALEMALFNGYHPLMRWHLGPETGQAESFENFEQFFDAFSVQIKFMADLACDYNNKLGEAHSVLRPTPMMSALMYDCIKKGKDATKGGALYNTSGIAAIGLADITDSLLIIKQFVYEENLYTLREICEAIKSDYKGHDLMRARMMKSVKLFGSNDHQALEMANKVATLIHQTFSLKENFRGGPYTVGFWSMSNHVAFGTLTGALPSGRLAGKPFTPGLTPQAHASHNLLDNIKDVSGLDVKNIDNNIAFNVKVVPSSKDRHEDVIKNLYAYSKAYCDLGGMQMQFNVLSSKTMRTAMENPDDYRDLLVRISGYNAYFVTLNRDMQMELIERAEYGL